MMPERIVKIVFVSVFVRRFNNWIRWPGGDVMWTCWQRGHKASDNLALRRRITSGRRAGNAADETDRVRSRSSSVEHVAPEFMLCRAVQVITGAHEDQRRRHGRRGPAPDQERATGLQVMVVAAWAAILGATELPGT
jgi:hypothetical protein